MQQCHAGLVTNAHVSNIESTYRQSGAQPAALFMTNIRRYVDSFMTMYNSNRVVSGKTAKSCLSSQQYKPPHSSLLAVYQDF